MLQGLDDLFRQGSGNQLHRVLEDRADFLREIITVFEMGGKLEGLQFPLEPFRPLLVFSFVTDEREEFLAFFYIRKTIMHKCLD